MPRHLTRPLFAAWFVVEGLDAVRHPAGHATVLRDAGDALARRLPDQQLARTWAGLGDGTVRWVVRLHGLASVAAATALAAGVAPRTSAAALALLTAPVAAANLVGPANRVETPAQRTLRRERLVRTTSFAAGAALAATGAAPHRHHRAAPAAAG